MRTRLVVLVLAVLAVAVSACGVPLDTSAHALSASQFGAISARQTTTTTTTTPATNTEPGFLVYFLHRGVLAAVSRSDPSATTPPTVAIAVEAINNGPSSTEIRAGYESPLISAPGAQVSAGVTENGIVTVSLNANFVSLLLGVSLYEAYGEIVLTLVSRAFPGIKGVRFVSDGVPIAALLPNGRVVSGPVGVCAYASIATPAVKAPCS